MPSVKPPQPPKPSASGPRLRILALLLVLTVGGDGAAQEAITLEPVLIQSLAGATGSVLISSGAPVVSVFLSIAHDPTRISAGSIAAIGVGLDAEGVFPNILPTVGGVVCGIIVDAAPPFDGQTLPAGIDQPLLSIEWAPVGVLPTPAITTPLELVDGVFDSPPVTNTITQAGGVAITAVNGLSLVPGIVTLAEPAPPTFRITPTTLPPGSPTAIPLTLDNPAGPVSAYRLALTVPEPLEVIAVDLTGTITSAVGAELVSPSLIGREILVDVLLDAEPPFDGQTIPLGNALPLIALVTECALPPLAPDPALVVDLTWSSGTPSTVPAAGQDLVALTTPGAVTCEPLPLLPISYIGGDPSGASPLPAAAGETIEFGVHYTDPGEGIGGLTVTLCLDCSLATFVPGSLNAIGDALDEAEFIQADFDGSDLDGDDCEFALGALLDFLPPFDGAVLPPSVSPSRLFRIGIEISVGAPPGTTIEVPFCDGIDGSGTALLSNGVVIGTGSFSNFVRTPGVIELAAGAAFRRGDVDGDGQLNLADPVSVLQYLFAGGASPACHAAADFDADGVLQLNDPIGSLTYLFAGGPPPPAPHPACGVSPLESCDDPGSCGAP